MTLMAPDLFCDDVEDEEAGETSLMTDQALRTYCLERASLAMSNSPHSTPDSVMLLVQSFYQFLKNGEAAGELDQVRRSGGYAS